MKKLYTAIVLICLALLTLPASNAVAQVTAKVITLTSPNGALEVNEKSQVAEFTIKGLSSQAEVDQFIANALKYQKVISIKVSSEVTNGERKGTATFAKNLEKDYFKGLLTHLGVSAVIINGKETPVADLGKE
jgi:hypothetical protein